MSKITRVKKEKGFVQIDKFPLQDERLSWRAKGLLSYMLSMPDDWQFYVNELHKHAKDGKDSTRSALKELEQFGYLVIEKNNRSEKGKFSTNNYFLHERPLSDTGKPQRATRHGQTATTNNKETNNNHTNNNKERGKEKKCPFGNIDSPKDSEKEEKKEKIAKKRKNVEDAESYHELTQVLDLLKKRTGFAAKIPKTYNTLLRYGAYKLVHNRIREGHSLQDVLSVIDFKCDEWINDPKMSRYLTYDTLLRKSNFEKYLNQYNISKNRKHGKQQTTSHKSGKESLSIDELFKLIDEGGCESGF